MSNSEFTVNHGARRVMNIGNYITQTADRLAESSAICLGDLTMTWSDLNKSVDVLAFAFQGHGLKKGDRILLSSKNCLQIPQILFAAFKLGAVIVPVNYRLHPRDIAYIAKSSGACAYICHEEAEEQITMLRELDTNWKLQSVIGKSTLAEIGFPELIKISVSQDRFIEEPVCESDPAWFVFTSGTTGRPKAAILTHGQLSYVITNQLADLMPGLSHRDASLVLAPLSHAAGLQFLVQVVRGACSVFIPEGAFDPSVIWRLIEQHKVSNFFAVPTMIKLLVESPAIDLYDHSSLRQIIYAGSPMYREDQKKALEKLGPVLIQYYGLAEVSANITVLPSEDHAIDDTLMKVGSCGFARTGMQIDIQGADGQSLSVGESGEVCVTGLGVFAGYHNNEEANRKSFRNGWFRTGDLGYLDEDGYLYLNGRATDMFISGGVNIYPLEVEERLLEHPSIQEVAVFGLADDVWGEACTAVIVSKSNTNLNHDHISEWAAKNLAAHQRPKRYFFWEILPKSAYGKVDKKKIIAALNDLEDVKL